MVYDLINMLDCIDGVLITNSKKCIISIILNCISQNKMDWIDVGGLIRCLPSDSHHTEVGICGAIGPNPGSVHITLIMRKSRIRAKYIVGLWKLSLVIKYDNRFP